MKKLISKKGFSLIEVLVALSILVGGIIVISNTWSGNFLRMRKSALYNNVSLLLERKMVEFEAKYRKNIGEIPEEESGDFGKNYSQYRWEFKSQSFTMPDMTAALTARDGGADETMISMIKQLTDALSEAVVEAQVTVFVQVGKKEVKYSLTTYFVDFEKEISIGPAGGGEGGE